MTYSHSIWLWLAFAIGTFPILTLAAECTESFQVSSPEDVRQLDNCTTIIGNITFINSYQGPFVLPNTVNVTGSISTDQPDQPRTHSYKITSFEIPKLVRLGDLRLDDTRVLEVVSLPKLRTVTGALYVDGGDSTVAVDLRSLKRADMISLAGNFTSLNFESLEHVRDVLFLQHSSSISPDFDPSIDLTFPSLEFAGEIYIRGHIAHISMPELEQIGPVEGRYRKGLTVANHGRSALHLELPKLVYAASSLEFYYNVASVSMPALETISEWMSVLADIRSFKLEKLSYFRFISVKHKGNFNCDLFKAELMKTTGHPDDRSYLTCYKDSRVPDTPAKPNETAGNVDAGAESDGVSDSPEGLNKLMGHPDAGHKVHHSSGPTSHDLKMVTWFFIWLFIIMPIMGYVFAWFARHRRRQAERASRSGRNYSSSDYPLIAVKW